LRQAYDYWQDQPGNYYPFALKYRALRPLLMAQSHVHGREFIKLVEELIAPQINVQIPRQIARKISVQIPRQTAESVQVPRQTTRKISF